MNDTPMVTMMEGSFFRWMNAPMTMYATTMPASMAQPRRGFSVITAPMMQVTRLTSVSMEKSISPMDMASICPMVASMMGMAMLRRRFRLL